MSGGRLRIAFRRAAASPSRTLLTALGVIAAAAMLGAGVTVAYSLSTGFDRAANAAGLPDVIARFSPQSRAQVDKRIASLPNLRARAYRFELTNIALSGGSGAAPNGVVEALGPGPRGYKIVAGRDISGARGEVVVERGLARKWRVSPGSRLQVGGLDARVVGVAVSPDNVAYPLASAPHVYLSERQLNPSFLAHPSANTALVWLNDPKHLDETLTQARAVGYGLDNLRLITRSGVHGLINQAAGIVVSLLVGFSLVALAAAGVMLGASARSEVQRRLGAIGTMRALGFEPRSIAAQHALDAAVVAVPAGAAGVALGALAVSGPSGRLLEAINELPPGSALLLPLGAALAAVVLVVTVGAAWPAWRAARRSPVETMRGGDLQPTSRASRLPAGFLGLGARLAAAHRTRVAATVSVLASAAAIVLLLAAMASLLDRLQHDPATLGKRYQFTASLPPDDTAAVRAVPGVADAAPRFQLEAADSFHLGETLRVIAYPGDHTPFENPPLAAGRRVRSANEAEVGAGLADALGLHPGTLLALQLPSGRELRYRVVGIVRALDRDGRLAFVRSSRGIANEPGIAQSVAVRLKPGANAAAVKRRLELLHSGGPPVQVAQPGAATPRDGSFLGVLASVLRAVGIVNGFVCLYVLVQALVLLARERRSTIAVLRAGGARQRDVRRVLAGASLLVVVLAAPLAVALEIALLGPATSRLAAGYVSLPLRASAAEVALVALGLVAIALASAAIAARRIVRETVVSGLVGE
ncbi:MAG: FtsX-like permease family protein [Thermoleophilaceae bacterium]